MPKTVLDMAGVVNAVSSVAVEKDGEYLFVVEAKEGIEGKLNFPSGKIDLGETPFDAAQREFKEETGLEVELTNLCSVYYQHWDDQPGVTIRFQFWGTLKGNETSVGELAPDVQATKWLSPEEMKQGIEQGIFRNENTVRMVREVLAGQRWPLAVLSAK